MFGAFKTILKNLGWKKLKKKNVRKNGNFKVKNERVVIKFKETDMTNNGRSIKRQNKTQVEKTAKD